MGVWWEVEAPSLGETLLPSNDAGASETLSPDTMANCYLPIILEFPSGFWALGLALLLRSEDSFCSSNSSPCFLGQDLSLVENSPSKLDWLGQGSPGILLHLHSAGMAEHTAPHLAVFHVASCGF